MSADLAEVPFCSLSAPAGVPAGGGYSMCVGTGGSGTGASGPPFPNKENAQVQQYIAFYNSGGGNPCVAQAVPPADDTSSWGPIPPFVTAQGCCVPPEAWTDPKLSPTANASRATRLKAFTTASSVGAKDSEGIDCGIPPDLDALTKVWGISKANWCHGGVAAGNVGVLSSPDDAPFVIKTPNMGTWTQRSLLVTRLTGDNYDADKDPFGTVLPAPVGNFKGKYPYKQDSACAGCSTAVGSGQLLPSNPPETATTAGDNQYSSSPKGCSQPYSQFCDDLRPLSASAMGPGSMYGSTVMPKGVEPGGPNGYSNPQGRVGGTFATRDMYGPGSFSVLINLAPCAITGGEASPNAVPGFPRVSPDGLVFPYDGPDSLPGGRGPVFAMWTFSYNEAYQTPGAGGAFSADAGFATTCAGGSTPAACGQANPTQAGQSVTQLTGGGVALGNPTVTYPLLPGLVDADSSANSGYFAAHNHEIDIEIPANSQQFQGGNMTAVLGWNTANFNTWLSDTDQYSAGATAMYQQAQCTAPAGKFFAAVGPDDDQDTYHLLTFVWHVSPDNSTGEESYVAFLVDGVEAYRTHQYVPRRSGRMVVGLWPAWWGTNYRPMDFNQVYAKIARMEFVPQVDVTGARSPALITAGPQMYDQEFPIPSRASSTAPLATEIACGIDSAGVPRAPVMVCAPASGADAGTWRVAAGCTATLPCSNVGPSPSQQGSRKHGGLPLWAIVVIVVCVVVVAAAAVVGGVLGSRSRRSKAPHTKRPT